MKAPTATLNEWKLNREHSDIADIIEMFAAKNYSRYRVSNAIKSGDGTEDLLKDVNTFYQKKKERASKLLKTA